MLVCHTATKLPTIMDATERIISNVFQGILLITGKIFPSIKFGEVINVIRKNLAINEKPAADEVTARNAVTGVGEPSYTSGVQKWNGTDDILYPIPAAIITNTTTSKGFDDKAEG